jgi:FkbM family methyltransferase
MKVKKLIKNILLKISPFYRIASSILTQLENIQKMIPSSPPPPCSPRYLSLFDFFFNNIDKAEYFMQYIYTLIVRPGDYVIDVGANHGLHTLPLSKLVGESGKVLAFEAVNDNIVSIRNQMSMNNIIFFQKAVTKPSIAESSPEIQFTYFPNCDGWSGIVRRPEVPNSEGEQLVSVQTTTLDKVILEEKLSEGTNISFVKIDVEGGDFDVLLGAQYLLTKYKPIVIFESGRQYSANLYNYTKDDFFSYFHNLGYILFQFTGEEFKESDWDKKNVYFETWLVHKDSFFLTFFREKYLNFGHLFMETYAQKK